jgi:hypothetical protein
MRIGTSPCLAEVLPAIAYQRVATQDCDRSKATSRASSTESCSQPWPHPDPPTRPPPTPTRARPDTTSPRSPLTRHAESRRSASPPLSNPGPATYLGMRPLLITIDAKKEPTLPGAPRPHGSL